MLSYLKSKLCAPLPEWHNKIFILTNLENFDTVRGIVKNHHLAFENFNKTTFTANTAIFKISFGCSLVGCVTNALLFEIPEIPEKTFSVYTIAGI